MILTTNFFISSSTTTLVYGISPPRSFEKFKIFNLKKLNHIFRTLNDFRIKIHQLQICRYMFNLSLFFYVPIVVEGIHYGCLILFLTPMPPFRPRIHA